MHVTLIIRQLFYNEVGVYMKNCKKYINSQKTGYLVR